MILSMIRLPLSCTMMKKIKHTLKILWCEYHKIYKVCVAISHHARKGLTFLFNITFRKLESLKSIWFNYCVYEERCIKN